MHVRNNMLVSRRSAALSSTVRNAIVWWRRECPSHAKHDRINNLFTDHAQNETAGGMVPPADQQEVEITHNLVFLLLLMVIFDVKVKIIIKRR